MTTTPRARRDPILPMPTTQRGKVLFALGLVFWFALLMLPCALFWFASGNQINLQHASIPEAYLHPYLRIGTIMEPDARGLQITRSFLSSETETAACVQTDVRYLLWHNREGDINTTFCECYSRPAADALWSTTTSSPGACGTQP